MAESQRGKKFNDDIKEKAFTLLATNNNAKVVADTLGLKYTTVKTWEKKFLKEAEEQQKAKDSKDNVSQSVTNLRSENLIELRNEKKKEFIEESWKNIELASAILNKRLTRAYIREDLLDAMLDEALKETAGSDKRKQIAKNIGDMKLDDINKISTTLGTLYDKQALANGEATSREEVIKKFEDY